MTGMSITDAKDEAQKEMDEIVGNSFNKNKVDKKTTGDGVAFAEQGGAEEEFEYFLLINSRIHSDSVGV